MYNQEVKNILNIAYDKWGYSLNIDSTVKRGNTIYFYTLDREYEREVLSIRDALNNQFSNKKNGSFTTELKHLLKGDKWNLPQCACYTEQDNGKWNLDFYCITGTRFHKTYGNRIAASLILQSSPMISLSEYAIDTFYGFWDKTTYDIRRFDGEQQVVSNGINYRVNRNLFSNIQFRKFATMFFLTIANESKKYIYKDIARAIGSSGCFLPDISYQDVIRAHTPSELLDYAVDKPENLNINYNKKDINVGYMIAVLRPYVSTKDVQLLLDLTPEIVRECLSFKNMFDGLKTNESIEKFIVNYYRYVRCFPDGIIDYFLRDYVRMSLEENNPISLGGSLNKLRIDHDRLMIQARNREYLEAEKGIPLVSVPSIFDKLEETLEWLYPGDFKRMHTSEQLYNEGGYQHNCVFSRRNLIRSDQVAIFHWDHQGESYTIQFAINRYGKYYVDEIQARFNLGCHQTDEEELNRIVFAVNTMVESQ